MYALMALTLGGAMAGGGNMFGENNSRPIKFEDLSPEDKQRYLEKLARQKEENERRIALANGLKEFSFVFDNKRVYIYALNNRSAAKRCRKKLLELMEWFGKEGAEYPQFSPIAGTDISGVRKDYELGKAYYHAH